MIGSLYRFRDLLQRSQYSHFQKYCAGPLRRLLNVIAPACHRARDAGNARRRTKIEYAILPKATKNTAENRSSDALLAPDAAYPVWSPIAAHDAAATLLTLLNNEKARS
jgi:hypothetical protein